MTAFDVGVTVTALERPLSGAPAVTVSGATLTFTPECAVRTIVLGAASAG